MRVLVMHLQQCGGSAAHLLAQESVFHLTHADNLLACLINAGASSVCIVQHSLGAHRVIPHPIHRAVAGTTWPSSSHRLGGCGRGRGEGTTSWTPPLCEGCGGGGCGADWGAIRAPSFAPGARQWAGARDLTTIEKGGPTTGALTTAPPPLCLCSAGGLRAGGRAGPTSLGVRAPWAHQHTAPPAAQHSPGACPPVPCPPGPQAPPQHRPPHSPKGQPFHSAPPNRTGRPLWPGLRAPHPLPIAAQSAGPAAVPNKERERESNGRGLSD